MKLVYPGWETPLVWRDGRFPLVVLEEPDYHFRIVQELCAAAGGADTAFVLSEGERLLDPARSLEVVPSPWSLVWDSRRIMTALYGRLKKECLRPELLGPAQEAAAAAARLAGRAGDCFSFPVVSEAGGDPMALLKALRLRPEPEEGPLAEQMLLMQKVWRQQDLSDSRSSFSASELHLVVTCLRSTLVLQLRQDISIQWQKINLFLLSSAKYIRNTKHHTLQLQQ